MAAIGEKHRDAIAGAGGMPAGAFKLSKDSSMTTAATSPAKPAGARGLVQHDQAAGLADRDLFFLPVLLGKGPADGNRRPSADHRGGKGGIYLGHRKMQRSAFSLIAPGSFAEYFRHQRFRIRPLCQQVAVAAVIGDDHILGLQRRANTRADSLLSRAQDHHSRDFTFNFTQFRQLLFESVGEQQRAEHFHFFA
jgi:hypothetical protein